MSLHLLHNGQMLAPDDFTARCLACVSQGGAADAVAALLPLALDSQRQQPGLWGRAEVLHASDDLMIVDLTLPAFGTSAIHDHSTWAVIGISSGCEIDEFFAEQGSGLVRTGRREIHAGEAVVLDPGCIHFIGNPAAEAARGIHVYGKHLGRVERRMWDPQTCEAQRMDVAVFEQWEKGLTARSTAAGGIVGPMVR